jgi:hypothetical protein
MKDKSKSAEDLVTIRAIMENSTRFLSLSGLAGVFAGSIALIGGAVAFFMIFNGNFTNEYFSGLTTGEVNLIQHKLIIDAFIVLVSAVTIALFLSYKKAAMKGLRLWTPVSKRLLVNMLVPLTTGGILVIIFFQQNHFQLIIPSMLIFYGLALVNAGKFTYSEVFYLGIFEIITGLASVIMPQFGLFFWLFGFGLLHISYGLLLYRKYEK